MNKNTGKALRLCITAMALLFIFSPLFLLAQERRINENTVSPVVKAYIREKYPDAGKVRYYHEMDNDTLFTEAEFASGSNDYSLKFLQSGKLHQVEKDIPFGNIPDTVREKISATISKAFPKYRIVKCQQKFLGALSLYEISFRRRGAEYEYHFTMDGRFVKMEEKESVPPTNYF